MRRRFLRKPWTVGSLAALAIAAMSCSTTKSAPPEEDLAGNGLPQMAAPTPTLESDLGAVYFETDSAILRDEGRKALDQSAQQIRSNPEWQVVTIEGHCDERGNEEYNLALGERRASAVRQYLADLGVPKDRLKTRSLGEMVPASPGHDEIAWRMNRRAQLEIGGD